MIAKQLIRRDGGPRELATALGLVKLVYRAKSRWMPRLRSGENDSGAGACGCNPTTTPWGLNARPTSHRPLEAAKHPRPLELEWQVRRLGISLASLAQVRWGLALIISSRSLRPPRTSTAPLYTTDSGRLWHGTSRRFDSDPGFSSLSLSNHLVRLTRTDATVLVALAGQILLVFVGLPGQ